MFNVTFFPVYGLLFGINYASQTTDEDFELEDDVKMLQLCFGLFGVSLMWFTDSEQSDNS